MAQILLFNAGSSSVKWKLFAVADESVVASGQVERINTPQATVSLKAGKVKLETVHPDLDYPTAAKLIIKMLEQQKLLDQNQLVAIGHRVVAGGQEFVHATKLNDKTVSKIEAMSDYAPLHNPQEVSYIKLMQELLPDVEQFAVFDSQFFTQMPVVNAYYSLPYALTEKYQIRRYGEHGISHSYLANAAAKLLQKPLAELKLITLHLGNGASACAIKNGTAYDSSMGFTPLCGLTMGTRAGDVDPSIVPFLMEKEGYSAVEVMDLLNDKSGLYGITGGKSDMRDIEAGKKASDKRAQLAYDIFINRVVKYVGSFFVELGGADAIVFAGGIGEHQTDVRQTICDQLKCLNIKMDAAKNAATNVGDVTAPGSATKVLLIPTNEELAMLQQIKSQL